MKEIYFWQRIVSPLMAGMATSLVNLGANVIYVAESELNHERTQLGWKAFDLKQARLLIATDKTNVSKIIQKAPSDSIHLCQGIRSNGFVQFAQNEMRTRGLRQWAIIETINDIGLLEKLIKRNLYKWLFWKYRNNLDGILAIGSRTPDWIIDKGVPSEKVYPFAYFVPTYANSLVPNLPNEKDIYRIIYVGQLVERKRIDLLINALSKLNYQNYELYVVGDGNERHVLEQLGNVLIPNRINWIGSVQMSEVSRWIVNSDCLVLPSRHDGWGAVVSEALMAGTPAICSDACGSSVVVRASGVGGVFPSGDVDSLTKLLEQQITIGKQSYENRCKLSEWAQCLGAEAGAKYLMSILAYSEFGGQRPHPPWEAM